MALAAGVRIGHYEVLAPLGAGGMGEVYRARDPRLQRDVAIKVLPASVLARPDRVRRFEQEARTVGSLNHPSVVAIYDVGSHEGSPYLVSEYLEGETLRERLIGASLPKRKVVEYGVQIAQGLAAAHDKGIVHRDLKPENVFITRDGRVKILDFGLAKLTAPTVSDSDSTDIRLQAFERTHTGTEPGTVLGTVDYMSPEQVRGRDLDQRSDLFSFGAILYEMLSGKRAFRRDSPAETMSAILREDLPPLTELEPSVPLALDRIVLRCLEKDPEERFQSARDLGFALEAVLGATISRAVLQAQMGARWFIRRRSVLLGLTLVATVSGALLYLTPQAPASLPTYQRLTFRRGAISSARFSPDGNTIVYAAAWEGRPLRVYFTRTGALESSALDFPDADVLAISSTGEMAISLSRILTPSFGGKGTLARVPLSGGAPRPLLQDVDGADWSPDGKDLLVFRRSVREHMIEYPMGTVLYRTINYIHNARFSRQGDKIAFIEHGPGLGRRSIRILDVSSRQTEVLSEGWQQAWGLAFVPSGNEVWFTASEDGRPPALHSVSLGKRLRVLVRETGWLFLQDIDRSGRVLMAQNRWQNVIVLRLAGEEEERYLSWFDRSIAEDLSNDGGTLLFNETGEAGGESSSVYVRKTDGALAVRLGDGRGLALSPDGTSVLCRSMASKDPLFLLPTGPGRPRTLHRGPIELFDRARWLPDGKRILIAGNEPGKTSQLYVQNVEDGVVRPICREGQRLGPISPDGAWVASPGADQRVSLCSLEGDDRREMPAVEPREVAVGWSSDSRSIYVHRPFSLPARIDRIDVATQGRTLFKVLKPSDPGGVLQIDPIMTPDGRSYGYNCHRLLSDLYLVEGLR